MPRAAPPFARPAACQQGSRQRRRCPPSCTARVLPAPAGKTRPASRGGWPWAFSGGPGWRGWGRGRPGWLDAAADWRGWPVGRLRGAQMGVIENGLVRRSLLNVCYQNKCAGPCRRPGGRCAGRACHARPRRPGAASRHGGAGRPARRPARDKAGQPPALGARPGQGGHWPWLPRPMRRPCGAHALAQAWGSGAGWARGEWVKRASSQVPA